MAAFVVSVEKVSTTFDTTTGATSNTVNLSKSQDETQCVPFHTVRTTAGGTDYRDNNFVGLEMIDNSGTPAVRVHRYAKSAASQIHVDIFVVEMGSNVNVFQASGAVTGTSNAFFHGGNATAANSFCVFSQVPSTSTASDDFNDTMLQASFPSTTLVQFDRRSGGTPDWTVYAYVVESDGTDFTTQYISDSWLSQETGPTNVGITSVTTTKAFVIPSYETAESSDDLRDAICNVAITAATTLTWYRDNGTTPAATGTGGWWIVKTSGTEFSVQRFALDLAASTTNDQSITSIDQTKAIIVSSNYIGGGAWSIDGTTTGSNVEDRQNTLVFQADDTVRAQQQQAEASTGSASRMRFEVVEFELEGAPPAADTYPGWSQSLGGWH